MKSYSVSNPIKIKNQDYKAARGHRGVCAAVGLMLLAFICSAVAEDAKSAAPAIPKMRQADLTPMSEALKPVSAHSPFQDGDCSLCHQNKDPKDPGPITKPVNSICLDCHDDFAKVMARKSIHVPAKVNCVTCHNPHNSKYPKLLVQESQSLCLSCHTAISNIVSNAKVKHDALTAGAKCLNCHNPHAANVEHLLTRLPFDLCVGCHGKDGLADHNGKALTNMKSLLANNPHQHGPVADKDCSACHNPHGSDNFRLLTKVYPAEFYSAYDPKLYALCFDCHEESMIKDPKTTTLTKFRNGDQNLHYVHVNKDERGRTCRACHEVHASQQVHQIRDAVPYGRSGYLLKVNFTQNPNGGTCARTCHVTRSYTNSVAALEPKPAVAEAPKPAAADAPKAQ
ncbi:MAG TPA: cytochrome c3 family protein [Verrucomicrobiae bacterium]